MNATRHAPILAALAATLLLSGLDARASAASQEAAAPSPELLPFPKATTCDPTKLEPGRSYWASAPISLAPSRTVPATEIQVEAKSIPSREEFVVAEVVSEGGSAWYLVAGRFDHGWVSSARLAGVSVELSEATPVDGCAAGKARVRNSLDEIARDRAALGKAASVKQLVDLDSRIRKLMGTECAAGFLDESTSAALGISTSHWSDEFVYSGKILGEAHEVDPGTSLRSRTLFGTVERYGEWHADGVPDFTAAKNYLREFPEGPFAADSVWILARAYKMAYLLNQEGLDCVSDQLSDVTSKPAGERNAYAKKMAEGYYQQLFRMRRPDEEQRRSYESFHSDGTYYDYCSD